MVINIYPLGKWIGHCWIDIGNIPDYGKFSFTRDEVFHALSNKKSRSKERLSLT